MRNPRLIRLLCLMLSLMLVIGGCGTSGDGNPDEPDNPSAPAYTVGGTATGLSGTLILQDNGGDDLTVSASGAFTFGTAVADGAAYLVTVGTQPAGQTCTVNNGNGTISSANVTNVSVICSSNAYTVGGTVSGLSGTLVLKDNGADDLTLSSNGAFTFATAVADGAAYSVTVGTQPAGQTCTVNSGNGTISGSNVANVSVICSANAYTVGGTVSGLSGTLVLKDNGGDDLTLSSNGAFTFATAVADGATYSVTVGTQPAGQTCTVTSDTGTISGANVTSVSVACVTNSKAWVYPSSVTDNISPAGSDTYTSPVPVAMDNNGNAIITWLQSDGTKLQVFKAEYRGGVWTYPSSLSDNISPDGQDVWGPTVAMDDSGNAIITWQQSDGANTQIFKSEYRGGVWTNPSSLSDNISPDGQAAYSPTVAMDHSGNAIIAWQQSDGASFQIFKAEYRGGVWTYPSSLSDNISPDVQSAFISFVPVAMDNNGNAIITWQQSDGANYQVFKSEYRGGVWTNPSSLADNISPDGQDVAIPNVAMDNSGNAIITWCQPDGSNMQVFKSEYRGGVWTNPLSLADNISPDGQNASYPSNVAMDDSGNAIIVWYQNDGANVQTFKSEYRGGVWVNPSSLSDNISPDGQNVYYPQVAMDNSGNAIISWDQSDGSNQQIFKSEYRSGAWTNPSFLTDNISPDGHSTGADWTPMAMDDSGNAIIVWYQSDATNWQMFKAEYR